MFKNGSLLKVHIEKLVYNYIQENATEVTSRQLGLSSYAGDIYVTKDEIIVCEDHNECFRKYAGFENINNIINVDGYYFYNRSKRNDCKVGSALDYYWQKEAIKNYKNKED